MKLTDLNRYRRIGASSTLLEIGPHRVLIDAGMDPKEIGYAAIPDYSLIGDAPLDLILLTHCHLDHLGSLPMIVRDHPEATVACSRPSHFLAARMLRNSYNVMRRQKEELAITEYPLYTKADIQKLDEIMLPVPFGQMKKFGSEGQDLEVTFFPAGHVAGAAGIRLVYKHRKIFITGDVLFTDQRTLPGADFPEEDFDTIILETTRGRTDRTPETSRETETARFLKTIRNTLQHGGSVLIPTFALGRMQEVLTLLRDAQRDGDIPESPVICSGLGLDLVDYFDAIARKTGAVRFHRSVLKELGVRTINRYPQPGRNVPEKGIYLLSSGMLVEHTPSYIAASCMLEHPENAVCFVGYCDPETPGGKLLASHHDDSFLFETLDYSCKIRAAIEQFDLSGHADRDELLNFALSRNPRAVVLAHGDPEAREWFDDAFAEHAPNIKVTDPIPSEQYQV
ncbi:MBL fold metallo-hydrolase [Rubellicoccus peritrichatus]|uniref:MBL fold metallo-hydrolase n=1 Tax=Rubellicoccus peritrichatus TaxID=3080537 RepID=A0AAQ3LIN7_9BACT|nr:MBL fold metallo-hydrolase [Puniceicoccus sp. CR14]WOO42844.1 MBL fold metallo-hydrolase [Puniceicoccus sp. CR14]